VSGLPVRAEHLTHRYRTVDEEVVALDDVSFLVRAGTAAAISGPSGSGKSTLTGILAGLQRPSSGVAAIGDADLGLLTEREVTRLRAQHLAVIAQNPDRNLIGWATAVENLRFAQRAGRALGRRDLPEPEDVLHRLGLAAQADVVVDRLSGGQRQRLALGTGIGAAPDVLLADEPTSQLDPVSAMAVVELLLVEAARGTTVIAVTHDPRVAAEMDLRLELHDGRLAS
jgi:putative ABC transport system ATP-binding protein